MTRQKKEIIKKIQEIEREIEVDKELSHGNVLSPAPINGEYRTMYDNLSTAKNYTLDASPVALGLASNEYVTEFMFVFGVVPANFRQVEVPKVDCTVVSWIAGGSQFTNTADVGGVYNGQWIQAVTRWTTKVYGKPTITTLPKTGY